MPSATVHIDSVAIMQVTTALPLVQAYYAPADATYVRDAALHLGLTRLTYPYETFPANTFDLKVGAGITPFTLTWSADDEARITALVTQYGTTAARVRSAALCIGLSGLAGSTALRGPFEP